MKGAAALAILMLPGYRAAAQGVAALPSRNFLDSIGACTHIGQGVDQAAPAAAALAYAGIRNIRDDESSRHVRDWIAVHGQAGVKVVLTRSGPGDDAMTSMIESSKRLAAAGALLAMEGPNEPNNWAVTYQGRKSESGTTFMPVAEWQRAFYGKVKGDPVLKRYPVFHSSEAGGSEPDNVGLQFLTIPAGAGTLMPDGTRYADYANVHNYISRQPHIIDNMAWQNADPVFHSWTDGLYVEYGKTWRKGFPGYSDPELVRLPRVTTETGWVTGPRGLTEEQQGRLYLNIYLAQFKQGFRYTFIYMLRDGGGGDEGYGIFDIDYRPKRSARYLHNLTSILADKGSVTRRRGLPYRIPNRAATVHNLLLQKSNGTFDLVVWDEQANGTSDTTVDFGAVYPSMKLYDPTIGTAPIRAFTNVRSVPLVLSDHPIVIELPTAGRRSPPRAPA